MSSRRFSRHAYPALVVLVCALPAFAVTWPLVTSPLESLPIGREGVSTVPLLNAWTVWWNADRAAAGFRDYWQAPIFAPTEHAFAFSEAQPTTLLVAPIVATFGPVLAYNVYLLGVLTLNGIVAFRLLRRVGIAWLPALLGGAIVAMLPILQWQAGVLQLTTLCGVLWVVDRLVALCDGRTLSSDLPLPPSALRPPTSDLRPPPRALRIGDSVLLGLAGAACYAACNYFGLFLSVLLPLSFLPLVWGRWLCWRFWMLLAASLVVAGGLSSPILYAQVTAKSQYEWSRDDALLFQLSAKPRDYLNPYRPALVEGPWNTDPKRPSWTLGMGPFTYLLAGAGAVAGLLMRGRRRWTLFLLLFGGCAFVLSLGLTWEVVEGWKFRMRATHFDPVRGWLPYKSLMKIHPGLALARSPFRFAFFVQIVVGLLAAGALDALWTGLNGLSARFSNRGRTLTVAFASTIVAAAGLYAALEVVPTRQKLATPPSLEAVWIGWVRDHGDPSRPIVCLPFPPGDSVGDYERTAAFMFEQIGHRRTMIGGYSGFFPPAYLDMKSRLRNFPDEAVLAELRSRRVEFIVAADAESIARAGRSTALDLAFRDEDAKVNVYELRPVRGAAVRAVP